MQPSIADLEKRIANLEKKARRTKVVLVVTGLLFFGTSVAAELCLSLMVPTDLNVNFGPAEVVDLDGGDDEQLPDHTVPTAATVATDENGDAVNPATTFTLEEVGPTADLDLPFNKDQFGADIPAH